MIASLIRYSLSVGSWFPSAILCNFQFVLLFPPGLQTDSTPRCRRPSACSPDSQDWLPPIINPSTPCASTAAAVPYAICQSSLSVHAAPRTAAVASRNAPRSSGSFQSPHSRVFAVKHRRLSRGSAFVPQSQQWRGRGSRDVSCQSKFSPHLPPCTLER